jgi:hypothetical protein
MRIENGKCLVEIPCWSRASSRYTSYSLLPTFKVERLPKLLVDMIAFFHPMGCRGRGLLRRLGPSKLHGLIARQIHPK